MRMGTEKTRECLFFVRLDLLCFSYLLPFLFVCCVYYFFVVFIIFWFVCCVFNWFMYLFVCCVFLVLYFFMFCLCPLTQWDWARRRHWSEWVKPSLELRLSGLAALYTDLPVGFCECLILIFDSHFIIFLPN